MDLYTTNSGDTFDIIAKKFYGKERYLDKLIDANQDYKDTVLFTSGVVLNIPEVDTTVTAEEPRTSWRE